MIVSRELDGHAVQVAEHGAPLIRRHDALEGVDAFVVDLSIRGGDQGQHQQGANEGKDPGHGGHMGQPIHQLFGRKEQDGDCHANQPTLEGLRRQSGRSLESKGARWLIWFMLRWPEKQHFLPQVSNIYA